MNTAGGERGSVRAAVEPMRWWHLDDVVAIEKHAFGDTAWTLADFYGELAADNRWCRVVGHGPHTVAGYVIVSQTGHDADLMTLAVRHDSRGLGVGRSLLRAAVEHAARSDVWQMFLEVSDGNSARELYELNGFQAIDRRRGYYADGRDAIVMRRLFPPGTSAEVAAEGGRQ